MNHNPNEQVSSAPLSNQHTKIIPGKVARDVVIVWILSAMGGFIVGISGTPIGSDRYMMGLVASNLLLGTSAFVIVGCLTPANRWRQLAWVAFYSWLTSLVNLLFGISISDWLFGGIFMAIIAGIGGGISLIFKKTPDATN